MPIQIVDKQETFYDEEQARDHPVDPAAVRMPSIWSSPREI